MGKVSKILGGWIGGESWIVPSGMVLKLPDGSAAAPSLTFTSDTNTGLYRIGSDNVGLSLGGSLVYDFSATALTISTDLFITREAAAVLQLGVDAAGVTNQMIKGPDRITSDGVGGNLTIAGGRNRGASVGGSIIFQTSPAAGAGVTGTLATVLTLASDKSAVFTGAITTTNITDSGLTITRIPFASTGGLLIDDADLTFATDTLSATKLISSTSVTTPQIYGSSADSGTLTLTSTSHGTKGTISVGRLTLSDLANADGIVFASLGTATKAIDWSASGLSGSADYFVYFSAAINWAASGLLTSYGDNITGIRTNYITDYASQTPFTITASGGNDAPLFLKVGSLSPVLIGGTQVTYKSTGWTSVAISADITKTAHGHTLAVGELVEIYTSSTVADKGLYRITALPDVNTITLDRVLAGSQNDVGIHIFKDVAMFSLTDATNGQMLTSFSAQNKPLQIGGTVLAATTGLTSTDIVIGANIGLSQTQAAGILAGTLTNSVAVGDPGIYFKVIDPATGNAYAVPGWLIP